MKDGEHRGWKQKGTVDSPRPREGRELMVPTEATGSRSEGRVAAQPELWLSVEEVAMAHTVVR